MYLAGRRDGGGPRKQRARREVQSIPPMVMASRTESRGTDLAVRLGAAGWRARGVAGHGRGSQE
eukprot:4602659-Alexandrium_andersonii.AAC.1